LNVLSEMGITARLELWEGQMRADRDLEQAVEFTRIRLCLPPSRDGEVRDFLIDHPQPETRELATIWWNVTG